MLNNAYLFSTVGPDTAGREPPEVSWNWEFRNLLSGRGSFDTHRKRRSGSRASSPRRRDLQISGSWRGSASSSESSKRSRSFAFLRRHWSLVHHAKMSYELMNFLYWTYWWTYWWTFSKWLRFCKSSEICSRHLQNVCKMEISCIIINLSNPRVSLKFSAWENR